MCDSSDFYSGMMRKLNCLEVLFLNLSRGQDVLLGSSPSSSSLVSISMASLWSSSSSFLSLIIIWKRELAAFELLLDDSEDDEAEEHFLWRSILY